MLSRRSLIASALALPLQTRRVSEDRVAGGHPGDPECGCAGTVARYTELGHEVVLLYLNRGEGYCGKASLSRCAEIRTAEAEEACRILKARAAFAGQNDGRAVVDQQHYEAFSRVLAGEKPDIVFTQWPIDRHRDHRAVSMLTLDSWWESAGALPLRLRGGGGYRHVYACRVRGYLRRGTAPARACYAHASQRPDKW